VQLHLGLLEGSDPGDTLLLSGGASEMRALAAALAEFVASGADAIAIHPMTVVPPGHAAELFAVASPDAAVDGYAWLCNAQSLPELHGKLSSLEAGHHYFKLVAAGTELMVSVGEYSFAWWQAQAPGRSPMLATIQAITAGGLSCSATTDNQVLFVFGIPAGVALHVGETLEIDPFSLDMPQTVRNLSSSTAFDVTIRSVDTHDLRLDLHCERIRTPSASRLHGA
jgi:hypothetical protein